ncbi:hypothetical protein G7074_01695 [Pedobacter sp. HDW13]|uniref:hypothetical protein n=1 Tax=Pedobacter sp. HDW13 TaxID=2714940 RepID=UPI00140E475A|nr:hypothetical protein [Pedobacter sp. HDW13]QIL38102.1 hypothetical protein G7074_01695 [Pedobacter sp. HDW13]
MKLDFYPEVYTYDLILNINVLKVYSVDAELMYNWSANTPAVDLNNYNYKAVYYLNNIQNIDKEVDIVIENVKFDKPLNKLQRNELRNELMYFCFELEKELLSTVFNDEDYLKLASIGKKITQIKSKQLCDLTINRIKIEDEKIANKVVELTCDSLLAKFIKLAKQTRFKDINSVEEVEHFVNHFNIANESIHLEVLGSWSELIQTFLHNESLIISDDKTNLNQGRKSDFPLTNEQSKLIYNLFDLFNLNTPRPKDALNHNFYIRNCINKYQKCG